MKLFIKSEGCPSCEAIKKRVKLDRVEGLEIYNLGEGSYGQTEAESNAHAEADLLDVWSAPTLVTDSGRHVQDPFEIVEMLKDN